jgi:hypothetical protein
MPAMASAMERAILLIIESVSGVGEKPKASASGVEHNVPSCSYGEHVFE